MKTALPTKSPQQHEGEVLWLATSRGNSVRERDCQRAALVRALVSLTSFLQQASPPSAPASHCRMRKSCLPDRWVVHAGRPRDSVSHHKSGRSPPRRQTRQGARLEQLPMVESRGARYHHLAAGPRRPWSPYFQSSCSLPPQRRAFPRKGSSNPSCSNLPRCLSCRDPWDSNTGAAIGVSTQTTRI